MNTLTITKKPASSRGYVDMGWLKSAHSFSFGSYFDPNNIQFENLRVINDDYVAPRGGFPTHPHQNFEIFSYVQSGGLEHKDSIGNGSVVHGGGVQYMSAGTGVYHSEFNASDKDPVKFLQIWLVPAKENTKPRYDTFDFAPGDRDGKLKLFLSHDGREGSLLANSHTDVYAAELSGEQQVSHELKNNRSAYIHVVRGTVTINGESYTGGDAAQIYGAGEVKLTNGEDAEVILFEFIPQ
ncbi:MULTISPECIES: pirin family protein [Pseudovibrio]|uniref:pirin family protein n=1 Tax=Stappiaceae TaxID=2821832 RepID=UPI0023654862|nr:MULTISPECIES: pirin family protein [Pseudovibrio]MDD7910271.1 pirin family protein [Pseudovibrio exalbescens]MDX5593987.1 pirin family protein [Pseudovibrio sp. SPO723]